MQIRLRVVSRARPPRGRNDRRRSASTKRRAGRNACGGIVFA
jgi:hypothetical protein